METNTIVIIAICYAILATLAVTHIRVVTRKWRLTFSSIPYLGVGIGFVPEEKTYELHLIIPFISITLDIKRKAKKNTLKS